MSRVLILDDEQIRHETYDDLLSEHEVSHVYDADSAIAAMRLRKFDVVFLDHDLRRAQTGYDVAKWMTSMPRELRPDLVVVHSWNYGGARNMFSALVGADFNALLLRFGEPVPVLL